MLLPDLENHLSLYLSVHVPRLVYLKHAKSSKSPFLTFILILQNLTKSYKITSEFADDVFCHFIIQLPGGKFRTSRPLNSPKPNKILRNRTQKKHKSSKNEAISGWPSYSIDIPMIHHDLPYIYIYFYTMESPPSPRIGSAVSKISGTLVELRAMNESRSRQRREIRVYLSNQDGTGS